jgi:replicative DNA helicase
MMSPDDELAVVIPEHLRPVGDEQAVLGACLLSPRALDEVIAQVPTPAIFWQPGHGDVWTALAALWERGERPDALTVAAELSRTGQMRGIGGPAYLHTLVASTPAIGNASHYLRRVLDAWQLRAADVALRHGRMLVNAGDGGSADVILDVAARELEHARDMRHRASGAVRVGDLVDDVLSDLDDYQFEEDLRGIEAPYRDLGEILNPAMPGQMICFAGRPGTGKSTVLKDYCEHAAFDLGLPSLLLTYEMKAKEITTRTMSRQARVALSHLTRPGLLTDDDRARIADYRAALAAAPFYVVDVEDTSVAELDRLIRQYEPRIVAVDYLQLAVEEGPAERRRLDVERYSRSIKKTCGQARSAHPRRLTAQPGIRDATRPPPPPCRPARVRRHRTGLRRRRAAAPRGPVRTGVAAGRGSRLHRREATQRPNRRRHAREPPALRLVRRHGPMRRPTERERNRHDRSPARDSRMGARAATRPAARRG